MTEAEWLSATDPRTLMEYALPMSPARKIRLASCAAARAVLPLLADQRCRTAVELAEQYADDRTRASRRKRLLERARSAARAVSKDMERLHGRRPPHVGAAMVVENATAPSESIRLCARVAIVGAAQHGHIPPTALCDLLRCIFGNPFRPATLDPSWLTPTVGTLATGMYADRAFDCLPILADALQDAGCEDAAVLAHCRGPGPHARGCWVVDSLTRLR